MSYEGFSQNICEQGHYFEADAFEEDPTCKTCSTRPAWTNAVDDTNCDAIGKIPKELLIEKFRVSSASYRTCPTCHHVERIQPDVFRIPQKEETEPLRHGYIWDATSKLVPLSELGAARDREYAIVQERMAHESDDSQEPAS